MERAFYLWIKSPSGDVDIEVKVVVGGAIHIQWPDSFVDDESFYEDFRLRAGIPESSPIDQHRYVVDTWGWRAFDPKRDTWTPDGYDEEDPIEEEPYCDCA